MSSGNASNVLIIGLGEIGYCNAEYMTSRGLKVDGYDISDDAIQVALDSGVIRKGTKNFGGYDYYVISISTHAQRDMSKPSLDGLFETAIKLSREGKIGSLVSIESTIMKGVSRRVNDILDHRMHVVHFPHRYYAREKLEHGVKQMRVLGGCEPCCLNKAMHFYGMLLDIPMHLVNSAEVAELSKVVENSYRFLDIAFAEELKLVCHYQDVDFEELRNACNTKWNVEILEARNGIGGHCLPKDSQMYIDLSKGILPSIVESAKLVDSQYRQHLIIEQKRRAKPTIEPKVAYAQRQ